MELDRIYNLDCREGLRAIPDKSVDLIVTDPPYNIGKEAAWDKWKTVSAYVEFMGEVFKECERVLKDNGTLYFFHNDFPQIAALADWLAKNTRFKHNSFIIWDKGDWRALAWKNPKPDNTLRSWFNTCEYALMYTFEDTTGLTQVMHDVDSFPTLRTYFKEFQQATGLTKKAIIERVGGRADHAFRWSSTQWDLPTPETYAALLPLLQGSSFESRSYDSLKAEYADYRQQYESRVADLEAQRFVHNLDAGHNNVWRVPTENKGQYHSCQKPLAIIDRMIRTSSNEGAVVLDPFMGSGTTAVAARNLGRRFIGFERDPIYYNVCLSRLAEGAKGEAA